LEAELKINLNDKLKDIIKNIDFSELCITSKATISFSATTKSEVNTIKAIGTKCAVCWKISEEPCPRHS
tara:strand:+ start:522 stop:728 length:207 start_codon:yes stop_codon:yes gene_type:complete